MSNIKTNKSIATKILPVLLFLIDYLAILAAESVAQALRCWIMQDDLSISTANFYITFPALFLTFIHVKQLYYRRRPFYLEARGLFKAAVYATVFIVLILYVAHDSAETSRLFIGLFSILVFVFTMLVRYAFKTYCDRHCLLQARLVIIGSGRTAEAFARSVENDVGITYKVIGVIADDAITSPVLSKYPVLGGRNDIEKVVSSTGIGSICIADSKLTKPELTEMMNTLQPLVKHVMIVSSYLGSVVGAGIEADPILDEKLLMLRTKNNLAKPSNLFVKAVFDYVLTLFGTILISPFLLILALMIRLDSPGPVIYDGKRLGKNAKEFKCYKFRSMYTNGDEILEKYLKEHPEKLEEWQTYHKLEDDPRVTKIGAIMRRTSLDELPQIFNVLLGDMSLVGPRPYLPSEREEMEPSDQIILMAKPGITGFWQVSGRSDVTFYDRLAMDEWYVRNWNVWMDIMLLYKTFSVVLFRRGAY